MFQYIIFSNDQDGMPKIYDLILQKMALDMFT